MTDIEFYELCAEILGTTHIGKSFDHHKRTRWNNRTPGRGRYPGFGLIRLFGNIVHVALVSPVKVTTAFDSKTAALDYLRALPR